MGLKKCIGCDISVLSDDFEVNVCFFCLLKRPDYIMLSQAEKYYLMKRKKHENSNSR